MQTFTQEYSALGTEIKALSAAQFPSGAPAHIADLLDKLIQTHDYIGVCLLLAIELPPATGSLANDLLVAACCEWVITAQHDQAIRHLALCWLRQRDFPQALQIAEGLATRNPDNVNLQLFVVQILAETPGAASQATQKLAAIDSRYRLTTDQRKTAMALEQSIGRQDSGGQETASGP